MYLLREWQHHPHTQQFPLLWHCLGKKFNFHVELLDEGKIKYAVEFRFIFRMIIHVLTLVELVLKRSIYCFKYVYISNLISTDPEMKKVNIKDVMMCSQETSHCSDNENDNYHSKQCGRVSNPFSRFRTV